MTDIAKILGTSINWMAAKWDTFEQPPSELEQISTLNFFETGIKSNRFFAVGKAVSAIAISGAMIVENLMTGVLNGVTSFTKCDGKNGFKWTIYGIYNSASSAYNIINIFVTASAGLIPGFNKVMYQGMNPHLQAWKTNLNVKDLTQQLADAKNPEKNGSNAQQKQIEELACQLTTANQRLKEIEEKHAQKDAKMLQKPTASRLTPLPQPTSRSMTPAPSKKTTGLSKKNEVQPQPKTASKLEENTLKQQKKLKVQSKENPIKKKK